MKPISLPYLFAALLLGQLAACGQTGPLYLPSKPKAFSAQAQAPAATPEQSAPSAIDSAPAVK